MRPIGTLGLIAALTIIASGERLPAQQQTVVPPAAPAKTGTAEISGVVLDSLNGRYLQGAEVIIEGAKKDLVTDSAGTFRLAGLPPGSYQVGVFHPLLDTLGISLGTKPFHVGPDSVSVVILSVPSAATIIRRACPTSRDGQDNSAVIGYVRDPETLQPVAGAEVSIAWTLVEVSKQFGIRNTPHVVRDTADATGAFQICGLPVPLDATLQARTRTAATSEIPISLGGSRSALFVRTILLSRADSGATARRASVTGRVILEGSPARAGSRVELVGTDVVAMTNENGEFTMTNLPSGSQVLLGRHLGYGAATVPVELNSREPQKVTITLPKFVAMMDPVLVTARRNAALDRVGFNQRRRSGFGHYLGPDQLRNINAFRLTDIFRRVPGLRVSYGGAMNEEVVTSSRGGSLTGGDCVQYYIDDMPWMSAWPGDVNSFVNANEVVAVEVYQGPSAPPQYTRGMSACTTIVLWTRFKVRDVKAR